MNTLKILRLKYKKTVKEMAESLGIGLHSYYKVEKGVRKPTYKFLCKFYEVYGEDVLLLIDKKNTNHSDV